MNPTDPALTGLILDSEPDLGFGSVGQLPIPPNPEEIGGLHSRFRLFDDVGIGAFVSPKALVSGMIAAQSLSVLVGAPKLGKTFLALDLAMSVAIGLDWFGRSVVKGPVVYIAAEGVRGIYPRIRAWKVAHDATGRAGVHFLREAVRLTNTADVEAFIALLKEMTVAPVLVIIDTLARSMAGTDENSPRDMSAAISATDRIREKIGAAVLLIHHPTKGGSESRGSSHLEGAVDMMASLIEQGDHLKLTCKMTKDFPEFEALEFRLAPVGPSLVVVPLSVADTVGSAGGLSKSQMRALQSLAGGASERTSSNRWKDASGLSPSTFHHAQKKLLAGGYVERQESANNVFYTMTDRGRVAIASQSNEPAL